MSTKHLIMAFFCLLGLTFTGCEKNNSTAKSSDLDGTKWAGTIELTDIEASFVDEECYITMSGYAVGTIRGAYKESKPNFFVTVINVTGDADGQVKVGDTISGTYDLRTKTMTVQITLYGSPQTIILTKK